MGRRKIEIQPLSDERTKSVTFAKRKAGLFKKAYELSVLCEVDMAVIIVGSERVYEFSSVDTKELMNYYSRQRPVESKSPEDYGEFKRRRTLKSGSLSSSRLKVEMQTNDIEVDSDFESVSPEPVSKRQKRPVSSSSIYAAQPPPVQQQFVPRQPSQSQKTQVEAQPSQPQQQRPVLRVQIPSEAKSSGDTIATITPTESDILKQEKLLNSDEVQPRHPQQQPPSLNATRFPFTEKFRSPESRKQMPQLHIPMNKSQSSSPSSAPMPQLPVNGSAAFMSSLPPPSPSGHYPLPTPIFQQVFNSQYLAHMGGGMPGPSPQMGPLNPAAGMHQIHMQHQASGPSNGTADPDPAAPPTTDVTNGAQNGGAEPGPEKFKPRISSQQSSMFIPQAHHMQSMQGYMNGEQTPISALPSRYMTEIFPSPSNLYPSHEWPTGLTPYSANISHYFAGMPPSANGQAPPSANPAFASNRASLPTVGVTHRPPSKRALSSTQDSSQGASLDGRRDPQGS